MAGKAPIKDALTLHGPAGSIEALLETPREHDGSRVAVLCHPHPLYKGTMLNKVVHTLARTMNEIGMPALRFNFRGVGASEGEYGDGYGEGDDAAAVAEWARERFDGADVWLCGFSFGGMAACRAALSANPAQLLTVAPPAGRMSGILDGRQPGCPWLIVQGEDDEVVSCDEVVAWVNSLEPGPDLVVLPDVDHFFHGRLTVLRNTVLEKLNPGEK